MLVRTILTWSWIAEGLLAFLIQFVSLKYATGTWAIAKRTQLDSVMVMAQARLRSNWVRLSIITVNILIGVASLLGATSSSRAPLTILGVLIAFGFILNELAMTLLACWWDWEGKLDRKSVV